MNDTVADRRLHPTTLISRTLRIIPEAVGGMAAYGVVIARAELGRVLILAAFGLIVAGVAGFLMWWRFRYGVGERDIVIEAGVFSRKRRVIPFERVQDIAIEQRLLARLFGTARVRIETGGASADEGHLDSIALADAHRLRDIVRGRSAAGEAPDRDEDEPVLFAMAPGRVLFSGLFNFSLVFVAGIFAALQYADELGVYDPKELMLPFEREGRKTWLVASLYLLPVLVLLGFTAGVLRTFARDFGFRLTRTAAGLRRRRGLFTLSEAVIPIRRIQLAAIESGFVARALGWHRLAFQTLGADPREQGLQTAAPFARTDELSPILAEAGYRDAGTVGGWDRGPRRSILRRAFVPLLGTAATLAAALVSEPLAGVATGLLLLAVALSPLRWSRHAHATSEEAFLVTEGVLRRRLRIMPFARAQSIDVLRSPLQRLLGLATVAVDTAGASRLHPHAAVDLDRAQAEALAARLLELARGARRRRTA